MKIILNRLRFVNFKNIRSAEIVFNADITTIFGANATGKTTIMDGFLWLLFDKDSTDRKDFEVKTLDANNKPYHKLEHEVEGEFTIDGITSTLRKTLREKWVKPRGQKDEEFAGHETVYFWNDVPLKKNEYQAKIAELVNETTFKLLTNPTYFNTQLKWQDRRSMLLQVAGDISDSEILESGRFSNLIAALAGQKTVEDVKKEVSSKKKKIKDELELVPARIDEAKRNLPDEENYDLLLNVAEKIETRLANIDKLIADQSDQEKEYQQRIAQLLNKKQEHSRHLLDIEFQEREKVRAGQQQRLSVINGVKSEYSTITHQITSLQASIERILIDKNKLSLEQNTLRIKWKQINEEQLFFNESDFSCPTCKRAFEASNIEAKKEEMLTNFNTDKSKQLDENVNRGKAVGVEIKELENIIAAKEAELANAKSKLDTCSRNIASLEEENVRLTVNESEEVTKAIAANSIHQKTKADIADIDAEVSADRSDNGKQQLLEEKSTLQQQFNETQAKLNTKPQRERIMSRIAELEKQESEMAQQLADLEGIEFSIEQFNKEKMDQLERRVNGLFQTVTFKMFEEQINGGQTETCVALINGVPYTDANTASKINAGIDIINVLANHFNVYAPIFIDNRESVSNVIETDCQLINLVVSAADKKLRIENSAMATLA